VLTVVVVVVVCLLPVSVAAAWWLLQRLSWLSRRSARRVVVHTKFGKSFEGTLHLAGRDGLVLVAAKALDHDVDLGGHVFIPRGEVAFVQTGPS